MWPIWLRKTATGGMFISNKQSESGGPVRSREKNDLQKRRKTRFRFAALKKQPCTRIATLPKTAYLQKTAILPMRTLAKLSRNSHNPGDNVEKQQKPGTQFERTRFQQRNAPHRIVPGPYTKSSFHKKKGVLPMTTKRLQAPEGPPSPNEVIKRNSHYLGAI